MQQAVAAERNEPQQAGDGGTARICGQEQRDVHEHVERNRNPVAHLPCRHHEAVRQKVGALTVAAVSKHRQNVNEDHDGAGGRGEQHERAGNARNRVDQRGEQDHAAGHDNRLRRNLAVRHFAETLHGGRFGILRELI